MLNKPKFMRPSTNKEECTIDLTATSIPFSCIVDGNESILKWQIKIYDIINDDEVFKTNEITLKSPFYPVDEKNRNIVFTKNLYDYMYDESGGLIYPEFKNREEAYYWTITFWGSSDNSITSYQEVFYANKTPSIKFSFNEVDVDLNASEIPIVKSKDCTFKAVLDFDGDAYKAHLKRYGWRITDDGNGQVLVDTITKNQIYGSADNIICRYDGFLNGSNYSIELYVETQNNTKITSSFKFTVSYVATFLSSDFKVETLKNEPAIMLNWGEALVIAGILKDANNNVVSIDDTTFKTNYPIDNQCSIEIPDKSKVIYDGDASLNFDINENSYIAFSTQMLSDNDAILFLAEGTEVDDDGVYEVMRQLSYTHIENGDGVFTYEVVGRDNVSKTHKVENKPTEYVWYNIFMPPLAKIDEFKVYEGNVINCIYPREDKEDLTKNLYPRKDEKDPTKDFYPTFGRWSNLKEG